VPLFSNRQAGRLRWPGQNPQFLGEAAIVAGGILLIGLTLHQYPAFEIGSHAPSNRPLYSASEADRQIDSAKSYLNSHPDDMNTYVALAMAYYAKGPDSYVEAMNALEKARSLGATSEHLFFYAGMMYESLALPDYAINEYTKYLRHHPNDYETMIRLGNLHFRQKHFDEAQALYKEALRVWPKDATAWFNNALIQKEKGNYAEALQSLVQVVKIAGRLPPGGLFEEGEIYRLKGEPGRALQSYQQELAVQPTFIPALEALESMAKSKGDLKQARALRKRITDAKHQQAQTITNHG
jgi:tetratricopeptide (TPR) repeat protein